jgi:subtilisin family serine protease
MLLRPSKTRTVAFAAAALLWAVAPASASKQDPRLQIQRKLAAGGTRTAGSAPAKPGTFRVLVQVAAGTRIADLRASYPTARFRTDAGTVFTATVPGDVLDAFESDPRVLRVEGVQKLHPFLDVVRSAVTSGGQYLGILRNGTADLSGATGAGAIVGIVDSGIDYTHADFRSGGASRILALWDQTDTGASPGPPNFGALGFSCSSLNSNANTGNTNSPDDDDCTSTEWSQATLTALTAREADTNGHGTHVAGIAASNGNAGSSPGTYIGGAPQAGIIFVKTGFWNDEIIDGVKYIAAKAAALGKPAVINLSLGGQIDPHDGTSPFDAAIAAVAANTPVVVAMGNDGTGVSGTQPHALAASIAASATVNFTATTNGAAGFTQLDFWSGSPSAASLDTYSASVSLGSTVCGTTADGVNGSFSSCAGHQVFVYNNSSNGGFTGGDTNTANDREILVWVNDGYSGSITVSLTCTHAGGCGRLDGFTDPEGAGSNFTAGAGYSLPSTLTMGSPATANNVIAVGSYATKHTWTAEDGLSYYYDNSSVGSLSLFSGQGPTRDGRQKPDVAAPGDVIASSLSSQLTPCPSVSGACSTAFYKDSGNFDQILSDGAHAILAGTSMAAPVVTGVIAGRLQSEPTDTVAQIRAIVQGLARTDTATAILGAAPNTGFGYGKVVGSPQPISPPTSLAATALGISSITWSWNGTLLAAKNFDVYYATNTSSPLATAVTPPYTQMGLLGNATYGLLIRGVGGGIEGPSTSITTATYAAAPVAAPTATGWASSVTVTYAGLQCPAAPAATSCSGYAAQVGSAADFSGVTFASVTTARTLTTLVVTGLTPSTGYFLRLGTLNPLGAVSWGPFVTFNTGTNVLPPSSPSVDLISTGTLRLNWTQGANPPGLTYVAQASTAANFTGTLYSVSGTALSAPFPSLLADTSYYFRAQAVGGPFALFGPAATLALPPVASTNSFPAVGAAGLTTAWNSAGDEPDTLYQADVSPVSDFSSGVVSVQTRTTAAAFAGLAPNTAYYARVEALSRSGVATAEVVLGSTVTLVSAPTLPGPPFSAQAGDGFSFTFGNGGNPAGTRFLVQVSTDAAFTVVRAFTNTAATTASFTGLSSNQSYIARVAAVNSAGSPSAFVSASTATTVLPPLPAPVAVSSRTATALGLSWLPGTLAAGTTFTAQVSSSPAYAFTVTSSATLNASAILSGLQPNTTYFGQVNALSQNPPTPDGPFLSVASASTLPNPPSPAGTPFKFVFFTSATVAWTPLPLAPSSATAEGYRVEFSTDPLFSAVWTSSTVAPGAASATVSGLAFSTVFYARVGALSWESVPNWLTLGSTQTPLPPLSSGTVTGSGITLSIPPAFPQITSIVVSVPPGAFPAGTLVSAVASISLPLYSATSNEAAGLTPFGASVGIDLSAGGLQPAVPIRITMVYDPLQIPVGQDERHLQMWRFDLPTNQWAIVPSQTDPQSHTLTASVQHFSTFAPFFVTAGSDLSSVQVFPQPWEVTAPSSAYWAQALTFSGMPGGARVRLFTLTGEAIFDGNASGGGVLTWDGNTRYGRRAASGTYFATIEAGGQRLVRRVVLIR